MDLSKLQAVGTSINNIVSEFKNLTATGIAIESLFPATPATASPSTATATLLPQLEGYINQHHAGGNNQVSAVNAIAQIAAAIANNPNLDIPANVAQEIVAAASLASGMNLS